MSPKPDKTDLPNTTLKWNSPELKFDLPAANAFVRRDYREGWRIQGLG